MMASSSSSTSTSALLAWCVKELSVLASVRTDNLLYAKRNHLEISRDNRFVQTWNRWWGGDDRAAMVPRLRLLVDMCLDLAALLRRSRYLQIHVRIVSDAELAMVIHDTKSLETLASKMRLATHGLEELYDHYKRKENDANVYNALGSMMTDVGDALGWIDPLVEHLRRRIELEASRFQHSSSSSSSFTDGGVGDGGSGLKATSSSSSSYQQRSSALVAARVAALGGGGTGLLGSSPLMTSPSVGSMTARTPPTLMSSSSPITIRSLSLHRTAAAVVAVARNESEDPPPTTTTGGECDEDAVAAISKQLDDDGRVEAATTDPLTAAALQLDGGGGDDSIFALE